MIYNHRPVVAQLDWEKIERSDYSNHVWTIRGTRKWWCDCCIAYVPKTHVCECEKAQADRSDCPFCGHDPYEYVDIGVGMQRVAVSCCELGIGLIQYNEPRSSRLYDLITSHDKRQRKRGLRLVKRALQ